MTTKTKASLGLAEWHTQLVISCKPKALAAMQPQPQPLQPLHSTANSHQQRGKALSTPVVGQPTLTGVLATVFE